MRTTHTYALLEVSATVYDEVEAKLRAAGYDHAFYEDSIQMQGIALKRAIPEVTKRDDGAYTVGPPPGGKTVEERCDELTKVPKLKELTPGDEVSPEQLTMAVSLARDVLCGHQVAGCDVLRRDPSDSSLALIRALSRALHTAAKYVGRPTDVAERMEAALMAEPTPEVLRRPLCPHCKSNHAVGGLCSANHEPHCDIRTSRAGWDADCSCVRGRP